MPGNKYNDDGENTLIFSIKSCIISERSLNNAAFYQ